MRSLILMAGLVLCGPALAETDCKQQVDDAFAKLRQAKAFRMETIITNTQGSLSMRAEYVLPDRMHQVVKLGAAPLPMEMIVIGQRAWSNQGNGWAALPEKFAQTVAQQVKETVTEAPKGATDYKCEGTKEFEGKTYTLYQGVLPPAADVSVPALPNQQNIYVDQASGLPVRNIVTPASQPDKRLFDGTFTVLSDLSIDPPKVAN